MLHLTENKEDLMLISLTIILSLLFSGCHYKASTNLAASNLITPYGTAKDININRNSEVNVK